MFSKPNPKVRYALLSVALLFAASAGYAIAFLNYASTIV